MRLRNLIKPEASGNNKIYMAAITAFLLTVTVLAGCSMDTDFASDSTPEKNAISGYDPVAYFTHSVAIPGNEMYSCIWNDAKWIFSSKENMELFKSNPKRYAPQYNGYCAFSLSRNDYVDANPSSWAMVDGKLYMTYSPDIKNAWLPDKRNYIAQANRNWQLRIEK